MLQVVAVLGLMLAPPVAPPLSAALAAVAFAALARLLRDRHRLALRAAMTADLAQPRRARALARHLSRPPLEDRRARALLPRLHRARATSPSTSARTSATAPGRCCGAGARVVALEPQRLFHAFLRRDLPASVTLLPLAAGRAPGRATLAVSRLHPTVSSLAAGFAERMRAAPGFERVAWDAAETVEVTTLDALIAEHGLPRFVKIDVEGAEAEVLAGLAQPVPWIAFESLPANPAATEACLDRLAALGRYRFNLVEGERGGFALDRWPDRSGIAATLAARPAAAARPTSTPASMPADRPRAATVALAVAVLAVPLMLAQRAAPARSRLPAGAAGPDPPARRRAGGGARAAAGRS